MGRPGALESLSPAAPEAALVQLGRLLQAAGYTFTAVSPASHERVVARRLEAGAEDALRQIFGWNLPFRQALLPPAMFDLLRAAGAVCELGGGRWRAAIRWATLADRLYLHSGFPAHAADSVFFGPDTYRFVTAIRQYLATAGTPAGQVVDVGTGSGAGGLSVPAAQTTLTDINPLALRYAGINAALQGRQVSLQAGDGLAPVSAPAALIVANPPYLMDAGRRLYRDGGALGIGLSLRIAEQALAKLAPQGTLLLYTATPIERGHDPLHAALAALAARRGARLDYHESDPDIWSEELARPAYRHADRIALVTVYLRPITQTADAACRSDP
ncbi:MAG TPA: class I SAM-dependent methyltransferase [Gammaproteobacteria bacterium]|nr:class I SAM-dependent methyltransferase [Gammaproteobacteria bacterium]